MTAFVMVGLTYLIGAIPMSYLVAKYAGGIDLRRNGSGNLGTTNLFRALGWKYAVPVGILDITKGYVPVVFLAPRIGDGDWVPVAVGLIAVLGHVYPVYLGFAGGKGVATAAGVVLAIAPAVITVSVVVWVLLLWSTGFSSLASISGALTLPLAVLVLAPQNTALLAAGLVLAAFIVFTHRANIRRLLAGTESRFRRDRQ